MSNPTIEIVSLIDKKIILGRIQKEWYKKSNKLLTQLAKELEEQYFYEVGWYGSDGIYDISPIPELQRLMNKRSETKRMCMK